MRQIALLFLAVCLTGCQRQTLFVQSDYLTLESLASYHVKTPDPLLNCPPVGQRLMVTWNIPTNCLSAEDLHINLKIRFRTRDELEINLCNLKKSGTYIYSLLNDEYFDKGGIVTYRAQLIGGEALLFEWRHQLWADIIEINPEDEEFEDVDLEE